MLQYIYSQPLSLKAFSASRIPDADSLGGVSAASSYSSYSRKLSWLSEPDSQRYWKSTYIQSSRDNSGGGLPMEKGSSLSNYFRKQRHRSTSIASDASGESGTSSSLPAANKLSAGVLESLSESYSAEKPTRGSARTGKRPVRYYNESPTAASGRRSRSNSIIAQQTPPVSSSLPPTHTEHVVHQHQNINNVSEPVPIPQIQLNEQEYELQVEPNTPNETESLTQLIAQQNIVSRSLEKPPIPYEKSDGDHQPGMNMHMHLNQSETNLHFNDSNVENIHTATRFNRFIDNGVEGSGVYCSEADLANMGRPPRIESVDFDHNHDEMLRPNNSRNADTRLQEVNNTLRTHSSGDNSWREGIFRIGSMSPHQVASIQQQQEYIIPKLPLQSNPITMNPVFPQPTRATPAFIPRAVLYRHAISFDETRDSPHDNQSAASRSFSPNPYAITRSVSNTSMPQTPRTPDREELARETALLRNHRSFPSPR